MLRASSRSRISPDVNSIRLASWRRCAALLSQTMGRSVRDQLLPNDQVAAAMGHDFAVMFRWFHEVGYSVDIPALAKWDGLPLTTFADLTAKANWGRGYVKWPRLSP